MREKREEKGEKETKKVTEIMVFKDQNVLRDQVGGPDWHYPKSQESFVKFTILFLIFRYYIID